MLMLRTNAIAILAPFIFLFLYGRLNVTLSLLGKMLINLPKTSSYPMKIRFMMPY